MKGRFRNRALQALCVAAIVVVVGAAPAFAQVGGIDPVGGLGGGGSNGDGGGSAGGGGSVGGAVGDAVGGLTGGGSGGSGTSGGSGSGGSSGTVGGAVGEVIDDTVDGVTGGGSGGHDNGGQTIGGAVGDAIDGATGQGSGNGGSGEGGGLLGGLGQSIDDTRNFVGSGLGGTVEQDGKDGKCKCQLHKDDRGKSTSGLRLGGNQAAAKEVAHAQSKAALFDRLALEASKHGGDKIDLEPAGSVSAEHSSGRPILERIAQAAAETASKLAFPLTLTLIVAGFLMIQGRIDRKDPKLALAALDSDETLLSFQ